MPDKLGLGFSDQLTSGLGPSGGKKGEVKLSGRGWTQAIFLILLFSGLSVVLVRLIWLMVLFGPTYRRMSEENRLRVVPIKAARGVIFDKDRNPLALNKPVYRIIISSKPGGANEGNRFRTITRQEALGRMAQGADLELVEEIGREYTGGLATSHLLGYLGEVASEEVKSGGFTPGDIVGRGGIEEEYDRLLRGQDGARLLEVDTTGLVVREVGKRDPVDGKDLVLSLDFNLQEAAMAALSGRKGAVVVENPENGAILALVSSPGFDPDQFDFSREVTDARGTEKLQQVFADPDRPLFNRAIAGTYPPGSTFKIVSAIAGLESKVIDRDYRFDDKGFVTLGTLQQRFSNWYFTQYGRTEGQIGVVRAITRSTDTFFYRLGELLGVDRLADWSRKFGLGRETRIDLPGEAAGLVPDPIWKQRERGENWFLGDSVIMAIGQGNLLTTPLQINRMTGVIATGGKLCRPKIVNNQGDKASSCQELAISRENLDLVKSGMYGACETGGTAFPLFEFPSQKERIAIACKTGTAEYGEVKNRTHAWLTAFVEKQVAAEHGRGPVSITVLVEGAGEGSKVAAPVARRVLAAYFGVEDNYNYSTLSGVGE